MDKISNRFFIFIILLLVLFGFWMRFRDLDRKGFWLDEVFSMNVSDRSFSEVYSHVPPDKPPLYYLLLNATLRIKSSEYMARLPSAAAGSLGIALIAMIALAIFGKEKLGLKIAAASSLLLALLPIHIRYSQEARPYMIALLFISFAFYYFILITNDLGKIDKRLWIKFLLFSFLAGCSLYISWTLLIVNLLYLVYVVFFRKGKNCASESQKIAIKNLIIYLFILGILLLIPFYFSKKIIGAIDTQNIVEYNIFNPIQIATFLTFFGICYSESQIYSLYSWWLSSAVLYIPFAVIGFIWILRKKKNASIFLMMHFLGSLIIPYMMFFMTNHFIAMRYFLPVLIPYIIFVSTGCVIAGEKISENLKAPRVLSYLPIFMLAAITLLWVFKNPSWRAEWREFILDVKNSERKNTALVGLKSFDSVCADYYAKRNGMNLTVYELREEPLKLKELMDTYTKLYIYTVGDVNNPDLKNLLKLIPDSPKSYFEFRVWEYNSDYKER